MTQRKIKLLPEFLICVSVFLLIIPIRWMLCWIAAAILHELFHIIALKLCGFQILSVSLGALGAKIDTDAETGVKSILCALAGPLAGFLLLFFVRKIPMIALCGLFQSAANLLPIYPLDGGRALKEFIFLIFPAQRANKIASVIEWIAWIMLFAVSVFGVLKLHLGLLPAFAVLMLFLRKKYLANGAVKRYNIPNRN